MPNHNELDRRRLLLMAATASGPNKSFAPLTQIDAGLLSVGYLELGPADGPPVILLHGWPYDIHSFADVAPLLASEGYPSSHICAGMALRASYQTRHSATASHLLLLSTSFR